ncbi:polyprotein [iflavirus 1]|uniref:Polyprotein n=1 Tax=iflavirus 1 TaxID=2999245 RepID=A0AC61YE85_9VIRU|nr:polyprotein [iflavirus 1]
MANYVFYNFDASLLEIEYRGIHIAGDVAHCIINDFFNTQTGLTRKILHDPKYHALCSFYDSGDLALHHYCRDLLSQFIDREYYSGHRAFVKYCKNKGYNLDAGITHLNHVTNQLPIQTKTCGRIWHGGKQLKPKNKRPTDYSNILIGPLQPPRATKLRSIILLKKLHYMISQKIAFRLTTNCLREILYKDKSHSFKSLEPSTYLCIVQTVLFTRKKFSKSTRKHRVPINVNKTGYHEMETEGGDQTEKFEINKNTGIGVVDVPTTGTAITIQKPLVEFASTDILSSFGSIQDREFLILNFTWNNVGITSDISTAPTRSITLSVLKEVLNSLNHPAARNITLAPFLYFMYSNFDMEFKIVLNSNKFQFGQLQLAFNYQLQNRLDKDLRLNKFSISQMPHVLLDAGANNECILTVPFSYYASYLALHSTVDSFAQFDYGLFIINVLNSLSTIKGPSTCGGSVFVRFTRGSYTGMIDSKYKLTADAPDELTSSTTSLDFEHLALHEMESILPIVKSILDPNRDNANDDSPPSYLVPTMSHSWCIGNGISQPIHSLRLHSNVFHPSSISATSDSMLVQDITRVFGLVKQITWNTTNNTAGRQLFAFPGCGIWPSDYYEKFETLDPKTKVPTKYTTYAVPPVGVIASNFLYERGTLELRLDVVCSQFHNGRIMLAYVPGWSYGKKTVCPLTLADLRNYHHAIISIQDNKKFTFVIPYINNNPIRFTNTSSDSAASVPLSAGMVVCKVLNPLTCVENENPSVSINAYWRGGVDYEVFVPRQSTLFNRSLIISDPASTFVHPRLSEHSWYFGTWHVTGEYAIVRWGTASDQISEWITPENYWRIVYHPGSTESTRLPIGDTFIGGYKEIDTCIIAPYQDYHILFGCNQNINWKSATTVLGTFDDKPYEKLTPTDLQRLQSLLFKTSSGGHWFTSYPTLQVFRERVAYHEGSRMDSGIVINANSQLTTLGTRQLGESFMDLKDYCRRYVYEYDFGFKVNSQQQHGRVAVYYPIFPFLYTPEPYPPNYQFNVTRDNIITLLGSGFTFFEGSIRKRLLFSASDDVNIVVEHRPELHISGPTFQPTHDPLLLPHLTMNSNYAYYIQNIRVNPIVELSIPMYNPNTLLSSFPGQYTNKSFGSLGSLCISTLGLPNKEVDVHCYVYHSFGDDARYHMFQGFPPCAYLDQVASVKTAAHEGLFDWAINKGKDSIMESIQPVLEEAKNTIEQTHTEMNKHILLNLLTNITHCAIAQDIKNYCVAIISFCSELGLVCVSYFQKLVDSLYSLITRNTTKTKDGVKIAIGEGEFFDEHFGTVVSLIWCSACTALKVTASPPMNLTSLCASLLGLTGTFTRTALFLSQLATKFVNLVKYLYKLICCSKVPGAMLEYVVTTDSDVLVKWAKEVDYLSAPERSYLYDIDVSMQARVYYACYFGQYVMSQIIGAEQLHNAKYGPVRLYYDKILKLKEELVAIGKHPNVRRRPFFIWIFGGTGVGKSSAYEKISSELLRSINYKGRGAKTFTFNPLSQYYSGCNGQPSMYVDDLFVVSSEKCIESQCSMVYQVVTNAVFTPPMAEVTEKKTRYAPELLYANSNVGWVDYNMITDKAAFHKRRDVLAEQLLNETFFKQFNEKYSTNFAATHQGLKAMSVYISEQKIHNPLHEMDHVMYRVYVDPVDPNSTFKMMNFVAFMQYTKQKFVRHFRQQKEQFTKACAEEYEFVTCEEDDIPPLFLQEGVVENISFEQILDSKLLEFKQKKKMSFDLTSVKSYIKSKFGKHENDLSNSAYVEFAQSLHDLSPTNPFLEDILGAKCNFESYVKSIAKLLNVNIKEITHTCSGLTCLAGTCLYAHTYPSLTGDLHDQLTHINPHIFAQEHIVKFSDLGMLKLLSLCTFLTNLDTEPMSYTTALSLLSKWLLPIVRCLDISYVTIYEKLEHNSDLTLEKMDLIDKFVGICRFDVYYKYFKYGHGSNSTLPCFAVILSNPVVTPTNLDAFKEFIKNFLSNVFGWMKKVNLAIYNVFHKYWHIIKLVLSLIGVVLLALGGKYAYDEYKSDHLDMLALQEAGPYVTTDRSVITALKPIALSEGSTTQISEMFRAIKRNTVFLVARFTLDNHVKEYKARCLGISGNKILIIRHYLDEFKLLVNPKFFVRYFNNVADKDYSDVQINLFDYSVKWYKDDKGNYNLGIIDFGSKFPQFRKLNNLFASYATHSNVGRDGYLYSGDCAAAVQLTFDLDKGWAVAGNKPDVATVTLNQVYRYAKHGAGMCGTVLLSHNLCKIVGVHVAGVNGVGLSQPVWSEMFNFDDPNPMVPSNLGVGTSRFVSTSVLTHGEVSNPYAHAETGRTSIVHSTIHGVFPVTTEPAPLIEHDPRLEVHISPKKVGCEKHGFPLYFDRKDLRDRVVEDMRSLILTNVKPLKTVRPLTLEEVVVGLDLPHYDGLNLSTSEGFPLMATRPSRLGVRKGKRYLFDIKESHPRNELVGIDSKLQHLLDYNDNCRARNIIPQTVFVDCLKDARIKVEKCKTPGKTRIFSISPVQFTLQFNQLFSDFIAAYMHSRFRVEHGIGMDVFSEEWTELACLLQEFPNYCAADYSNFGPSLDMEFASSMLDIIIEWTAMYGMPESDIAKMKIMKHELLCSYHLCGKELYQVFSGIPSGSPITTPLNSLINSCYIRYKYLELAEQYDEKFCNLQAFRRNVRLITYGDDIVMSVSDDIKEWFNTYTLHNSFKNNYIAFTDASKSGIPQPFIPFNEVTFLKCYFILHPNLNKYLPGLEKYSIEDCCNWVTRVGSRLENTRINCECALRLAYGWGPDYYNYVYNKILLAFSKINENFSYYSWKELDYKWRTNTVDFFSIVTN